MVSCKDSSDITAAVQESCDTHPLVWLPERSLIRVFSIRGVD